jgi:hypothetical protein
MEFFIDTKVVMYVRLYHTLFGVFMFDNVIPNLFQDLTIYWKICDYLGIYNWGVSRIEVFFLFEIIGGPGCRQSLFT